MPIPREFARIMGFPDNFKLNSNTSQAYKQLGNSVVIDVLQYIIMQIGDSLNKYTKISQKAII